MKRTKRCKNLAQASILLCASVAALAGEQAVFAQVSIATVPVGNVNNASDPDNGFGTVSYEYNIGTYDVTANQYCSFLNAVATTGDPYGVYHPNMAGTSNGNPGIIQSTTGSGAYTYSVINGRGNYPATDVDFWNATRFANWLDNGQPIGQGEGVGITETGTYNLAATQMDQDLLASSNKTTVGNNQADNNSIVRSSTASWAIISEAEWYKGAYYDPAKNLPDSNGGHYWDYPDQSNDSKVATVEMNTGVGDTTPVGSYRVPSAIGTYDQGGDVYQWNETITNGWNVRGIRGGAFDDGNDVGRAASFESLYQQATIAPDNTGFRVVQLKTFAPGALLDVSNKSLILPNPPAGALASLLAQLQSGYNNGSWNGGSGITSSTAAADAQHLTAIGYIINDQGANTGASNGSALFTTFNNQSTSDGDILLKYTYYGDSNLDGSVDGSDYSLLDNAWQQQLTGWYNGDFNYDGVVNGSDFTLIDNSFNSQSGRISASIAGPTAQGTAEIAGGSVAVPEPSALALLAIGAVGLLRRRRRPV